MRTCLCQWITPVANEVAVLILQDPQEAHQAKGSATLLQLSLQRCQRLAGHTFAPTVLSNAHAGMHTAVLLYPPDPPGSAVPLLPPAPWPAQPVAPRHLQLVVLDATWRKSRRLLYTHPWLQTLPRWSLLAPPPSRYAIRQAEQPTQRSTLEATCLALQQLEANLPRYQPLLQAFDRFVAQQAAWRTNPRTNRQTSVCDTSPQS